MRRFMPSQGASGRLPFIMIAATVPLVLLGACGQARDTPDATNAPSPSGPVSVHAYYIKAADLPGEWRDSNPPDPGFRQEVCGVDIEPTRPTSTGAIRVSQGGLGPFVNQHVRLYDDEAVSATVVAELADALPTCTEYTTTGSGEDSPAVRFTVEPLSGAELPTGAVGWRQQGQGDDGPGVISDVVLLARDRAMVALVSYEVRGEPDSEVLDAAVEAADAKAAGLSP